jgi:hypothetical protein
MKAQALAAQEYTAQEGLNVAVKATPWESYYTLAAVVVAYVVLMMN